MVADIFHPRLNKIITHFYGIRCFALVEFLVNIPWNAPGFFWLDSNCRLLLGWVIKCLRRLQL